MEKSYILLDIGGTAVKYALGDSEGRLWGEGTFQTEPELGAEKLQARMLKFIEGVRRDDTSGIAISTAGVVDPATGQILKCSNIPGYEGIMLADLMEKATGLPCTVENDVNSMALGELWKGALASDEIVAGCGDSSSGVNDSVFCMAVGTGIGGAVIHGGRVLTGASCCGGEIGFFPMGNGKTLEDIGSVRGMLRHLEELKGSPRDSISGKKACALLESGDAYVKASIDRMIDALARGLAGVTAILDPRYIVVGGAMLTAHREYFLPRLKNAWRSYLPKEFFQNTELLFSNLGNEAQLLGALRNHLNRKGSGKEQI